MRTDELADAVGDLAAQSWRRIARVMERIEPGFSDETSELTGLRLTRSVGGLAVLIFDFGDEQRSFAALPVSEGGQIVEIRPPDRMRAWTRDGEELTDVVLALDSDPRLN
jgi:hypothetical protein